MIDFTGFKNRWLGKLVNYDGVQGYQCTDLGKEWLQENTGVHYGTMGDAIKWWTAPTAQLKAAATAVSGSDAKQGDIVIKRPNHEGIATGNINASQVEILEQNGHTGTGKGTDPADKIRTRWINRSDVAGLWRLRGVTPPQHNETVRKGTWYVRSKPSTTGTAQSTVSGGQVYATVIVDGNWRFVPAKGGYVGPSAW